MQVLIERACGLDVHKKTITACVLTPQGKEIRTFCTHTIYLIGLVDWIKEHAGTHVAMESTGVFWKPIVNLLESEDISFLVVNAQHMKAVPGRKTDVKDAESIPNSCVMACLQPVTFQTGLSGNCVSWFVTAAV